MSRPRRTGSDVKQQEAGASVETQALLRAQEEARAQQARIAALESKPNRSSAENNELTFLKSPSFKEPRDQLLNADIKGMDLKTQNALTALNTAQAGGDPKAIETAQTTFDNAARDLDRTKYNLQDNAANVESLGSETRLQIALDERSSLEAQKKEQEQTLARNPDGLIYSPTDASAQLKKINDRLDVLNGQGSDGIPHLTAVRDDNKTKAQSATNAAAQFGPTAKDGYTQPPTAPVTIAPGSDGTSSPAPGSASGTQPGQIPGLAYHIPEGSNLWKESQKIFDSGLAAYPIAYASGLADPAKVGANDIVTLPSSQWVQSFIDHINDGSVKIENGKIKGPLPDDLLAQLHAPSQPIPS